jgi:periplasmic divalent cation tolerance protein
MTTIIIYTTNPNQEEADKIANHLLKKRLIACVNHMPSKSSFWWKENIENQDEIISIFKTKSENWEEIKKEIKDLHKYETPCIIKINIEANKDYMNWINKETEKF